MKQKKKKTMLQQLVYKNICDSHNLSLSNVYTMFSMSLSELTKNKKKIKDRMFQASCSITTLLQLRTLQISVIHKDETTKEIQVRYNTFPQLKQIRYKHYARLHLEHDFLLIRLSNLRYKINSQQTLNNVNENGRFLSLFFFFYLKQT